MAGAGRRLLSTIATVAALFGVFNVALNAKDALGSNHTATVKSLSGTTIRTTDGNKYRNPRDFLALSPAEQPVKIIPGCTYTFNTKSRGWFTFPFNKPKLELKGNATLIPTARCPAAPRVR